MKRTNYSTCTSYSMNGAYAKWQRVYVNEEGERFVKTKEGYKSIEGTPCIDWLLKDEK